MSNRMWKLYLFGDNRQITFWSALEMFIAIA